MVFPDKEDAIWEKDQASGEWYLHNFYKTQPDLNLANPAVRDEVMRTMGYWLQLGVDGFRIDAVPFLFAEDQLPKRERKFPQFDPHDVPAQPQGLRRPAQRHRDVPGRGQPALPGHGGVLRQRRRRRAVHAVRLHRDAGDLPVPRARRRAAAGQGAAGSVPQIDVGSQWANFLRNHDELTLDKLSKAERQEVFDAFGPDQDMQLFDRGLRRRLPPMLGGDERRIRMAYSLMFSLPGTPVLFYGEEIGMGENLDVPGRLSVRTPMQWQPGDNGGFSTAGKRSLVRPGHRGCVRRRTQVNVARQRSDPDSLWSFVQRLISRYRQSPEIGWSTVEVLDHDDHRVLAHVCRKDEWSLLALHNFAAEPVEVTVEVPGLTRGTALVDLLTPGTPRADGDRTARPDHR